jgi:hypothetical protein
MFYVRPLVTTELLTQKMFIKVQVYVYHTLYYAVILLIMKGQRLQEVSRCERSR